MKLPINGVIHHSLDVLDSKMEREREKGCGWADTGNLI